MTVLWRRLTALRSSGGRHRGMAAGFLAALRGRRGGPRYGDGESAPSLTRSRRARAATRASDPALPAALVATPNAGRQFDPDVVGAFQQLVRDGHISAEG